ncbi:CsiV family protein [Alteromonas sp. AMM-1]|uniref:CsiV family protein n=1 Tax=Alteromonas sp. AMM-1 TaxID=3394233 RepID=UPI0039A5FC11
MRRITACLIALTTLSGSPVLAQEDDNWWFDIEVVLFSRATPVNELSESFKTQQRLTPPKTDLDLLSQYFQPDLKWVYSSLPECNKPSSPIWAEAPDLEEILATYYVPEPTDPYASAPEAIPESMESSDNDDSNTDSADPLANNDQGYQQDTVNDDLEALTDSEAIIIPPSPESIAAYWLESHVGEAMHKNVLPPKRNLSCVASQHPEFVTSSAQWHWQGPNLHVPFPNQTPLIIHGADWARSQTPHLLSEEQLTQQSLFTSVRWRKGIDRLAHFAWRQQVKFGQDKADTFRLFAGKNYAEQFTPEGEMRPAPVEGVLELTDAVNTIADAAFIDPQTLKAEQTAAFFNELNTRLSQPQPVSFATMTAQPEQEPGISVDPYSAQLTPIWELDGFIQVFLKYINRVPYLHVNSELFYRQPVPVNTSQTAQPANTQAYELVSVPFKQVRRVISTQLHYFDHPLFGMVVQIRRYDRPPADKSSNAVKK